MDNTLLLFLNKIQTMKTIFILTFMVICINLTAQVWVNRTSPVDATDVFGFTKDIERFQPLRASFVIETTGNNNAQAAYSYAMDGTIKASQYFAGGDDGLHTFMNNLKMSIWEDSMQWKINDDLRLFYDGFKLEFGDDGNTFLGKGVTPSTSSTNIANTVVGWLAGKNMEGGVNNTMVGFRSGQLLTTGDWNTVIGSEAANTLTTGIRNTYIGYRAGWNGSVGGSGNVFIGNRAGEGQKVSNKLVISNSETTSPLLEGDFANSELTINGDTRVEGETILDGETTVVGNIGVTGQSFQGSSNLTGTSPFIDFKPGGTSQFYIQYDPSDDELNIHSTGLGDVLKIKSDGKVYLPELATSEQSRIEVKPDGELVLNTYPTVYEYTILEEINYPFVGSCNCNIIPVKDLRNGDVLSQMAIRSIWNSSILGNPTSITLARYNKITASQEFLYTVSGLGSGPYNQEFNVNLNNHVVDLDNWVYYIYINEDSSYTYVRIRRNP